MILIRVSFNPIMLFTALYFPSCSIHIAFFCSTCPSSISGRMIDFIIPSQKNVIFCPDMQKIYRQPLKNLTKKNLKCYITPAADAKPSIYNPIKDY